MKKYVMLILAAFGTLFVAYAAKPVTAQAGYKIEVDAPQLKGQTINLGMYFYGKLYSKDTLALDDKGQGVFHKEKPLHEGMYTLYFSNSKVVDLLISDDQTFRVKLDTTDLVNKIEITGAEQSAAFQNYVKFISGKRAEVEKIMKQYEGVEKDSEADKEKRAKIDVIDKEVEAYQQNIIQTYGNKTFGIFVKALIPAQVPDFETENDSIRQVKQYYYNRNHFFDNINMSDPRMLYTAFFSQKIEFYIQRMIPQIPDTIAMEAVNLIEKSKGDTLTYQNMVTNMLNYALKNNMMGMDKVVMVLSEKYYLSGQAPWADSTLLKDLDREVRKVKHNQIGAPAPNLEAETFEGKKMSLSDLTQDYVLVYFYEPSCGHCKKETPLLYNNVYQKYKDDNFFEVFAFYIHNEKEEWTKFVNEHKLFDWVNVWDPARESYFWYYYDTSTTPGLYLLNKERKIIAKKIDLETLDMILGKELENGRK